MRAWRLCAAISQRDLSRNHLNMLPGLSIFVAFRIGIGSRLRSTITKGIVGILEKIGGPGVRFLRTGNSSSSGQLRPLVSVVP